MAAPRQFDGKVIAVTGGASGIGLCTVTLLASRGAKLSIADVNKEALEKAVAEVQAKVPGAEIISSALDVRDYAQVEAWIQATVAKFGKLDGAANLAGVIGRGIGFVKLEEQDQNEWDFIMGVNATGVMNCLKAQLGVISDNGAVCNASSIAGTTGRNKNAAYSASKHAVTGLTRSAAKEYGYRGVRVNAICPGKIQTPMLQSALDNRKKLTGIQDESAPEDINIALGRRGRPEEVAFLVAYLLSDESTYISGAQIPIDGAWNC